MEVAILDCSDDNVAFENFSRVIEEKTVLYDVHGLEFPENPDSVIVTGSRHGVYEELDWIQPLLEHIREYIDHGVPVLGVCFGHQAVAKALGGEVKQMDGYEIGYRPVELEDATLFDELEDVEYPFSTHQDEVVDLPSDVVSTAESEVSVHGFEHEDKPVFGVQFHPEFDTETIKQIIKKKPLSDQKKQELRKEVNERNQERAERTHHVLDEFIRVSKKDT